MDWTIEPLASLEDVDAMVAIEDTSFTNPWTREMYLAELKQPGVAFFFLARDRRGTAIGFCSFWKVVDEIHVNNLAVLPEWRRRGVGSSLLARVVAEGLREGARSAMLEVRESNRSARQLYEKAGFSLAGRRQGYYSKPVEDALVLRMEPLRDFFAG
jgi:ribosomal-protein-alanine N-acetyltransferase